MATEGRAPAPHCTALRRDGTPCRRWAVRGSDPPRCPTDGGPPPAQMALPSLLDETAVPAEVTATPLMLSSIDGIVLDLADKQATLSNYINACLREGVAVREMTRLFALHGQNAGRLGRLLRDRQALQADLQARAVDGFPEALGRVLDRLAEDLEVEL